MGGRGGSGVGALVGHIGSSGTLNGSVSHIGASVPYELSRFLRPSIYFQTFVNTVNYSVILFLYCRFVQNDAFQIVAFSNTYQCILLGVVRFQFRGYVQGGSQLIGCVL